MAPELALGVSLTELGLGNLAVLIGIGNLNAGPLFVANFGLRQKAVRVFVRLLEALGGVLGVLLSGLLAAVLAGALWAGALLGGVREGNRGRAGS